MLFVTKLVIIIYNYWLYLNKKCMCTNFYGFFVNLASGPVG